VSESDPDADRRIGVSRFDAGDMRLVTMAAARLKRVKGIIHGCERSGFLRFVL
jgi:hypothetical protein